MLRLLLLSLFPVALFGQPDYRAFKQYAFPSALSAAASGSRIAWAFDDQGMRNVYTAEGPAFTPVKRTKFQRDDGQEITSLSLSDDGQTIVFVRGGDHGSNWDGGVPVNPAFDAVPPKVQIFAMPFENGEPRVLAEGDYPALSPDGNTVAFIRNGQAYTIATNGSGTPALLFSARGTTGSLQWSPAGDKLLFVSNRGDHNIIGIYTIGKSTITWISPSFSRDASPRWSPDGKKIVYIRTPGQGGAPDSILVKRHNPWKIMVADLASGKSSTLFEPPATLPGSVPNTHGGYNLHWAANDRIVFMSYMDGWPHLYSIPSSGGAPLLLTPGNFMCEHVSLSADRRRLLFSANTGPSPLDIDRRHAARVSVDKADMEVLTPGNGLEWMPVETGDAQHTVFISATATRPPLPAVQKRGNTSFVLLAENMLSSRFPGTAMVTPRQVVFTAKDGVKVHGILFEPAKAAGKKPAVIYVHGGPPRQMLLGWHYSDYYANAYAANQYLASLGFTVLAVNYRLGIGYGYHFHNAPNGGPAGAAEYQDILAAADWLRQQPFTDEKRIGIYGGSYGGYLTALALARDSKTFAAGVDIHGVHDYVTSRYGGTETRIEKAPDYEKAISVAWQSSPISAIQTWTSPVLIIHADDDRNVRFNQSTDLIQRLEKKGVPIETMMIVDDTHHWMLHENAVKVYQAMADYFKRKL